MNLALRRLKRLPRILTLKRLQHGSIRQWNRLDLRHENGRRTHFLIVSAQDIFKTISFTFQYPALSKSGVLFVEDA
jgi:hypothetical protein